MEEVELAIKEMKNGKAARVDGIPFELLKCLGEGKNAILSFRNKNIMKVNGPKNSWRRCYYQYRKK